MVELSFIQNFIAEFAFVLNFVPFLLGMIPPLHSKSFLKGLFGLILLLPFYESWVSFSFFINLMIFFGFILYGLSIFISMVKYKGRMYAIAEYGKNPQKPKYGLNETLKRINNFIVALLACIFPLMSIFLGAKDITTVFGIGFLLLILIIMGNHHMRGHTKDTTKIDPKKVKVNLFTLMILTLILSLMILVFLSFNVSKYFPTLLDSYPFIVYFVIFPPLYVANYLLDRSRLTFFRDKDIAKIFVSNIWNYSLFSVIFILVLSDIPVAISVLKRHDVILMIFWVNGLAFLIAQTLILIFKKSLLYELESKLIDFSQFKCAVKL